MLSFYPNLITVFEKVMCFKHTSQFSDVCFSTTVCYEEFLLSREKHMYRKYEHFHKTQKNCKEN